MVVVDRRRSLTMMQELSEAAATGELAVIYEELRTTCAVPYVFSLAAPPRHHARLLGICLGLMSAGVCIRPTARDRLVPGLDDSRCATAAADVRGPAPAGGRCGRNAGDPQYLREFRASSAHKFVVCRRRGAGTVGQQLASGNDLSQDFDYWPVQEASSTYRTGSCRGTETNDA